MDKDGSQSVTIEAGALIGFLGAFFADAGLSTSAAAKVAEILVETDLAGIRSHGTTHAAVYLRRLYNGTLSRVEVPETVADFGAIAVLDARSMMGHLAADHAMTLAVAKARAHGAGVVAMRNSGHFGAAGRYATAASHAGCVGIVMANATPLIAAPGGAERLLGTNPLAIALPTADATPLVLDMAMSEAAFGRIRVAKRKGQPIPESWALTATGEPTTDPDAALTGLLRPIAGFKGFGLAMMIDLLSSMLSEGPTCADVPRLYEDMEQPFSCSSLFLALDVAAFRDLEAMKAAVAAYAARIRSSAPATGQAPIAMPGDRRAASVRDSGGLVRLDRAVIDPLLALAREHGLATTLAPKPGED